MANIQPGTYAAHPDCFAVCESQKGNLMVVTRFLLDGTDVTLNNYSVVAYPDGTLATKSIDSLKEWSGWDGADPYWFMDHSQELLSIPVEVVVENHTYPGNDGQQHTGSRIKWVNKPNASRNSMPVTADRSKIMAKFGARFRANASTGKAFVPGKSPAAAAPAAPKPAAAKPAASTPPAPPASPSTLPHHNATDCWNHFLEKVEPLKLGDTDRNNKWFALCDSVNPAGQDVIEANCEWNKVWVAIDKLDLSDPSKLPF